MDDKALKDQLDGLKSDLEKVQAEKIKAIADKSEADVKQLNEVISDLKDNLNEKQKHLDELTLRQKDIKIEQKHLSLPEQIEKSLHENKDKIAATAKDGSRFSFKAAEIITTGAFGAGVVRGFRESGINDSPMRRRFILDIIQTMNGGVGSNPLSWVERRPKEGGPAPTSESEDKPLMDWTYTEGKATAEYISVIVSTTKQALLNVSLLAQDINNELLQNLADELEYQIILGNGASPNLKGIDQYAKAFTGSTLAGLVDTPTIQDVVRAAILQARKGNKAAAGYERRTGYIPNYVLVSPDIAARMDVQKIADGAYLMNPFTSQDGTVIKGVRVIENDFIGDDDFYVGDFTKSLFNFVEGLTIETGLINDQFRKNQLSIRAEVYGQHRVKYHDAWAFVKGDFTSAKQLIANSGIEEA